MLTAEEGENLGFVGRIVAMDIVWLLVLIVFCNGFPSFALNKNPCTRPDVVNVGLIFSFDSPVGKVAKVAVEATVEDVNSNPAILGGTKLKLRMQDSNIVDFWALLRAEGATAAGEDEFNKSRSEVNGDD